MTLTTHVYVLDETDPQELFAKCRELIGATDKHAHYQRPDIVFRDGSWFDDLERLSLGVNKGQGLPALLHMYTGVGRPYRSKEEAAEHDPDLCNLPGPAWYDPDAGDCDGSSVAHDPVCWSEISFDTSYGYSDEQQRTCGGLHADVLAQLGHWLDAKGLRWSWQNEYTGEVHTGYDRLPDLLRGSEESSAWFTTVALPAILREQYVPPEPTPDEQLATVLATFSANFTQVKKAFLTMGEAFALAFGHRQPYQPSDRRHRGRTYRRIVHTPHQPRHRDLPAPPSALNRGYHRRYLNRKGHR